jgi:hypothetical protein
MSSLRVILSGGLGNQLFQYATGRALAERTGAELVLDTVSGFKDDKVYNRSYELDVFPGPKACRKVEVHSKRAWLWLRLRQRKRIAGVANALKVIDEKLYGADLDTLELENGESLLIGFWQDETYFAGFRDTLRNDLKLEGVKHRNKSAVAIHVRRVQYTRGVGEAYFTAAMDRMRKKVPGCGFHLFTDDPRWGKEYARNHPDMECLSQPEDDALSDFRSLCSFRHWIIANSTFSWWAAWLAEKEGSRILTPGASAWPNPNTPLERWEQIDLT